MNQRPPQGPLGQRLRQLRLARGLSQDQVAAAAGVTGPTVSYLERGGRTTDATARVLARVLEADQQELLQLAREQRAQRAPKTAQRLPEAPAAPATGAGTDRAKRMVAVSRPDTGGVQGAAAELASPAAVPPESSTRHAVAMARWRRQGC